MYPPFIMRNLDGRYMCVLSCMEDIVSGRLHIEECWEDRLEKATVFTGALHNRVINMYNNAYPYFLSGRIG